MTELLTLKQAGDLVSKTDKMMWVYVKRGTLPAVRNGRKWMVCRQDIEKLKKHLKKPQRKKWKRPVQLCLDFGDGF